MADAIHDFTSKLRQPALAPQVERYVDWRRSLAEARRAGRPAPAPPDTAPISLNLDLTTACNYRCDHCIDWDILNGRMQHDDDALHRRIRHMAERGLRSVILIGGGEPTLHPGFARTVRFLKRASLQIAVVSNGSHNERILDVADAFRPGDWVRLSLDAGSDALFRAMHRPAQRSLTLDEICTWVPKIKARNPAVRVGYSFVIVWHGASRDGVALHDNVDEIALAAERARASGFDYVAFKPVLARAPDGAEVVEAGGALECVLARVREQLARARAFEDDAFRVHVSTNLRVLERGTWRELTRQPRTCHMQAFRQVLSPDGRYNCPAHRGVAKARLGDATGALDGAGDSELAQRLDDFDASHECREVTCLYNGVNWWLEGLVAAPSGRIEPGAERGDAFL